MREVTKDRTVFQGAQGGDVFGYRMGKRQNKRPEAIASGFLFWLPPNVLARFWTSNHATRLKANAFRREFATRSQSSPLSAPFGRAGWSVRVQEGEPTKKPRRLAWFPLAPPAGLEPATP